jgi:hypothetical protein
MMDGKDIFYSIFLMTVGNLFVSALPLGQWREESKIVSVVIVLVWFIFVIYMWFENI